MVCCGKALFRSTFSRREKRDGSISYLPPPPENSEHDLERKKKRRRSHLPGVFVLFCRVTSVSSREYFKAQGITGRCTIAGCSMRSKYDASLVLRVPMIGTNLHLCSDSERP